MTFPAEMEIPCPHCDELTTLELTSMEGVYQGYCSFCGEWCEYNHLEALESEEAERMLQMSLDERFD